MQESSPRSLTDESRSSTIVCDPSGASYGFCVWAIASSGPLPGAHENQHEIASKFWSRSLNKSEKYDKELVETWKGDADGILIFVRDSFPFLSTP